MRNPLNLVSLGRWLCEPDLSDGPWWTTRHTAFGPNELLRSRWRSSMAVDAKGIPLGTVTAPANRHDSPLLVPTLEATSEALEGLPEGRASTSTAATTRV
jgi:hypothetical protein